jgi:hypothetical protein
MTISLFPFPGKLGEPKGITVGGHAVDEEVALVIVAAEVKLNIAVAVKALASRAHSAKSQRNPAKDPDPT